MKKENNYLKQFRINRNLTQDDIARITGTPQSSISKVESAGRAVSFEYIRELRLNLNLDVNKMIDDLYRKQEWHLEEDKNSQIIDTQK